MKGGLTGLASAIAIREAIEAQASRLCAMMRLAALTMARAIPLSEKNGKRTAATRKARYLEHAAWHLDRCFLDPPFKRSARGREAGEQALGHDIVTEPGYGTMGVQDAVLEIRSASVSTR